MERIDAAAAATMDEGAASDEEAVAEPVFEMEETYEIDVSAPRKGIQPRVKSWPAKYVKERYRGYRHGVPPPSASNPTYADVNAVCGIDKSMVPVHSVVGDEYCSLRELHREVTWANYPGRVTAPIYRPGGRGMNPPWTSIRPSEVFSQRNPPPDA